MPQVAEIVGVEYRTLHSWLKRGLLRPSAQQSSGTGMPNLFETDDLVHAKVIADLRHYGLPFERLTETAEKLADYPGALTQGASVLVNGSVTVVEEADAANAILKESMTLVYNTKHAVEDVRAAMQVD